MSLIDHPQFAPLLEMEIHRSFGLTFELAEGGRSRLSFPVAERMLTPAGVLHAGFFYTACDLAGYAALLSLLKPGESAATHDLHVSLMRSAKAGEIVTVEAGVVKRGRSLAFLDARITAGGNLLATARITKSMLGS